MKLSSIEFNKKFILVTLVFIFKLISTIITIRRTNITTSNILFYILNLRNKIVIVIEEIAIIAKAAIVIVIKIAVREIIIIISLARVIKIKIKTLKLISLLSIISLVVLRLL